MEQKKLEPGSEFNEADTNKDGVVSDKELLAMERLHQIERDDKLAERQDRKKAAALYGMGCYLVNDYLHCCYS